jgi:transposase
MPVVSYKVSLTQEERDELHELSHNGKRAARLVLNALVLLAVDRGEFQDGQKQSERDIAGTLHISVCSVNNLKRRFVEEGLEAALERRPSPPRRRRYDGDFEARLTALVCGKAPEGRAAWSLRLLADRLVELELVDSISHETVRRLLKKANSSPGRRRNG